MPSRPVLTLLCLGLLACRGPEAPFGIGRFVGKGIGAFMESCGQRPAQVVRAEAGSVYVFEVTEVVAESAPPSGPTRPRNIDNAPAVVPLGPAAAGSQAFQEPRVVPGTPEPAALRQVSTLKARVLEVRTGQDGVILGYSCRPR